VEASFFGLLSEPVFKESIAATAASSSGTKGSSGFSCGMERTCGRLVLTCVGDTVRMGAESRL